MSKSVIFVLLVAAMITVVAVAAGVIAYLGSCYERSSLTFQLGRIGTLWGAAILLLILFSILGSLVTDWTGDALAWLRRHNVIMQFLDWGRNEDPWSAHGILWTLTLTPIGLLYWRRALTPFWLMLIAGLHNSASLYIWVGADTATDGSLAIFKVIVIFIIAGFLSWLLKSQRDNEEEIVAKQAQPESPADSSSDDHPSAPRQSIAALKDAATDIVSTLTH